MCFLNKEKSELCMKQHFKHIFVKIIRLWNGMKVNQVCSYAYFYISSIHFLLLLLFYFLVWKYSSFLLDQIAEGCFCSTMTGIPLQVHSLLVEGLYQERWTYKGLYFKLLFKFLSFLNEVQKLPTVLSRKMDSAYIKIPGVHYFKCQLLC